MIINDFYREREDGVKLYRTYSDADMMILQEQTGAVYSEAVDVENSGNTYIETDTPIESEEITDSEALNILLGRENNEPSNGV